MATSQGISVRHVSQDVRFIPQQPSPKAEVVEMFRAALALARLHVVVDNDGARCAACRATAVCVDELSHSPDCAADRVLKAWDALDSKVRRKPAVSTTDISPISAA